MNIYLNLEDSARELDSKLLLALLASSKGHEVIISDQGSIVRGLQKKLLNPGIYHTKSLTPAKTKVLTHRKVINSGCKITSIDEEGGLVDYGYDIFAKLRFSKKTIKQASAVFTWGPEDFKTLKKYYPTQMKKIYMTGSPRVDLWRPNLIDYWGKKIKNLKKPFLLIPSNFGAGITVQSFYERILIQKRGGYLDREPKMLMELVERESEQIKLIGHFIEAIKYLSHQNKNYHIILRPHTSESLEAWKLLLRNIPNVSVIADDGVSLWIKNAFAILHNGCTTALEATFFNKPIITYKPFKANFARKLANDLGQNVTSLKDLSKIINNIFYKSLKLKKRNKKINQTFPKILINKIFVDEKETASKKFIKIWENMGNKDLSRPNKWFLFKLYLKIMKFNGRLGQLFKNNAKTNKNFKFPSFERKKVLVKIDKLKKILKIKKKLSCEFLSDKTLLIKQK
jgi:surface carbohydrate biosynthesis protein